jgi:hypothetical protein
MFHWSLSPCQHQCLARLLLLERANPQLRRCTAALRQHLTPEERIVGQEVRDAYVAHFGWACSGWHIMRSVRTCLR